MSLKLPPSGSPLREKFDLADVVAAGQPGGRFKLPDFKSALASGRSMIAKSKGLVRSVNFLALRFDGSIILLEVKAMSSKPLWVFGNPDVKAEA